MRTYQEILKEVARACNNVFTTGYRDIMADVVKAATEIYIAELKIVPCVYTIPTTTLNN